MSEERDGVWVDDNTFMPKDVWEKALGEAEGKELPLLDRPGGEVIGTATVGRNGQFHFSITDPVMRQVIDDAMAFKDEHLSIYSEPKERVWATSPGAQEVVDQMYRLPLTDAHIDRIMSSAKKVK